MCCLPIGCLKAIVGFGSILSIIISLGLLVLTIYINIDKKNIINNVSAGQLNTILIILYVASFVFMVLGICGLYGIIKNRKKKNSGTCFLWIYSIGVVVFFLVFLGATIFFFVGPQAIFGTSCQQGSKTDLVKQLYELNNEATKTLCSDQCPCYVNATNLDSRLTQILNDRGLTSYSDDSKNSKQYQQCLNEDQRDTPNILLMEALEQFLDCGGWCKGDDKYFKFTDINECTTEECLDKDNCHDKFESFMKEEGEIIGIACGAAGGICFINLVAICCICNHPSRKKREAQFYRRMMEDND